MKDNLLEVQAIAYYSDIAISTTFYKVESYMTQQKSEVRHGVKTVKYNDRGFEWEGTEPETYLYSKDIKTPTPLQFNSKSQVEFSKKMQYGHFGVRRLNEALSIFLQARYEVGRLASVLDKFKSKELTLLIQIEKDYIEKLLQWDVMKPYLTTVKEMEAEIIEIEAAHKKVLEQLEIEKAERKLKRQARKEQKEREQAEALKELKALEEKRETLLKKAGKA